jgi:hypothetical protein
VLDREVAVVNQWASGSGLSIETLIEAVAAIQGYATIKALGIASYDPECDLDNRVLSASPSIMRAVLTAAPRDSSSDYAVCCRSARIRRSI